MSGIKLPKYVVKDTDRHGNDRFYFRAPGARKVRIKAVPGTEEFDRLYKEASSSAEKSGCEKVGKTPAATQFEKGTFGAIAVEYFKSIAFRDLSPATQKRRRRMLEAFVLTHGDKRVSTLDGKHIFRMMNDKAGTPEAANDFLKLMRKVLEFAMAAGYITKNPARDIKTIRSKSDGFYAWSEDDIAKFEDRHPIGTKARLAFGLLLYTAQRRSDVVKMGPKTISGGMVHVRQDKTGTIVEFPIHEDLVEIIDASECGADAFLVTDHGLPFTANGFGNWFRKKCDEAGVPSGCSAHGLRKAASRRLAEAGCTPHEIMSITGHKTLKEVTRYTESVERRSLARKAVSGLGRSSGSPTHFVYVYRHEGRVIYIGQGVASRPLAHLGRPDFPPSHELRIEIIPAGTKDSALALEQNMIAANDDGGLLNSVMYRYADAKPKIIEHVA